MLVSRCARPEGERHQWRSFLSIDLPLYEIPYTTFTRRILARYESAFSSFSLDALFHLSASLFRFLLLLFCLLGEDDGGGGEADGFYIYTDPRATRLCVLVARRLALVCECRATGKREGKTENSLRASRPDLCSPPGKTACFLDSASSLSTSNPLKSIRSALLQQFRERPRARD